MKTKWIKLHPGTTTILKGWNQSAQGCVERTTLGLPPRTPTTLKGLHQSVRPVPVLVSSCTKWINFTCIVLVTFGSTAIATTNDLSAALQRGLFEEEANHNLDAAIQAYQSVINQYDKDRKLAATAIFRLAESYRKQGKTNEAAVQYGRIVREFTEEADLFIPSRDTLATLVKVPQPVRIAEASPTPSTSAEAEEIKRIQAMIKDSPDLINAKDTTTSQTPLHQAAQKGELIVARFLLDSGADVNAVDSVSTQGWTPLHYAAANGHKAMVELLLSRKADVHATDRRRAATALHLAAEKGFKSVAETLLDHGADISAKAGGRTPLFDAVAYGNAAVAELLISRGADPNAGAVLHVVARNGSKALAELLIANKANVNATNEVGETPLHVTAESGQVEIAMLLLSHGAEVEAKSARPDRGGWTPLQYAVAFQKLEMIRLLLENKADSNTRFDFNANLQGFTALMAAALFHNAETVDLLLSLTADPNLKSRDGMTALIAAFPDSGMDEYGKKVVNLLLNHGADAEAQDSQGRTPLILACLRSDKDLVKVLLEHKAGVNAQDKEGRSALHHLTLNLSTPQIVEKATLLLDAGADANLQDKSGHTPLTILVGPPVKPGFPGSPAGMLVALLRQHGALENVPRPNAIQVTRQSADFRDAPVFKDTNDWNHFTLLEVLAIESGLATKVPQGEAPLVLSQEQWVKYMLPFPNLERVQIKRPSSDLKSWREQSVDLAALLNSGDCSKDVPVQWGDVVEIPEADHPLNEPWPGFSKEQWQNIRKCLSRKVEVILKGRKSRIDLNIDVTFAEPTEPTKPFTERLAGLLSPPPPITIKPHVPFWIKPALRNSGVLLASSDLTRVKVMRTDPKTGKKVEWVLDCSDSKPAPDFWLRDGDVIEVPDKS